MQHTNEYLNEDVEFADEPEVVFDDDFEPVPVEILKSKDGFNLHIGDYVRYIHHHNKKPKYQIMKIYKYNYCDEIYCDIATVTKSEDGFPLAYAKNVHSSEICKYF